MGYLVCVCRLAGSFASLSAHGTVLRAGADSPHNSTLPDEVMSMQ